MKTVFLTDKMNFSGGRKLFLEYADHLRRQGHQVDILVIERRGGLKDFTDVTQVDAFDYRNIPECDCIVAMTPREVRKAWEAKRGKVVHFCQGFEITDLEQRLSGDVLPPRFQGSGPYHALRLWRKKLSWRKKLQRVNKVYQLPTTLITVSKHLKEVLEKRYNREVHLCVNGVHDEFFYPEKEKKIKPFGKENPLKIINIGPYEVTFKGIPTTFSAVKELKKQNLPISFTRVTPKKHPDEIDSPLVDTFHEHLPQDELGKQLRAHDVYISNSTEGEGFGLPAMEALRSGALCVLSEISSYRNFSPREDFCLFVPEGGDKATVDAVKKILTMDPDEFEKTRKNALEVASDYSHEKACCRFEEILQNEFE